MEPNTRKTPRRHTMQDSAPRQDPNITWAPIPIFRWVKSKSTHAYPFEQHDLMQLWQGNNGARKWVAVPIVDEEDLE